MLPLFVFGDRVFLFLRDMGDAPYLRPACWKGRGTLPLPSFFVPNQPWLGTNTSFLARALGIITLGDPLAHASAVDERFLTS